VYLQDREIELKLSVASPTGRVLAGREVAGARPRNVESIYFDTQDGKLRSAGFCLRLRKDRGRWLQTVKSEEDSVQGRYEHERPVKRGSVDFALLKQTPLDGVIDGDDDLQPIFLTRVRRRSQNRKCQESQIEFSLDEGEIIAAGRTSPILELELELKSGRLADVFAEARRLVQADGLTPAFTSKSERGYLLAEGDCERAPKFRGPRFSGKIPTGVVFQGIGRACLRQLTANAELLAAGARLEALHQVRVSLRRLRVALIVFRPVLADGEYEAVKKELRWLTGEMADARNLDVFIQDSFRSAVDQAVDSGVMATFGRGLIDAQHEAYRRAAAAVRSKRFRTLVVDIARWIADGEWTRTALTAHSAAAPCGEFARGALDKRRWAVKKRYKSMDWKDPIARHKLRIGIKKIRYASEFFAGLVGKNRRRRFDDYIGALEDLQESLGRLNDIRVGEDTARLALSALEGADSKEGAHYAAGVVVGRTTVGVQPLVRSARRACRELLESPPWW